MTRLLFIGLLTLADRRGRLRDEPQRIQVRVLPYDRVKQINVLLDALVAAGLMVRYTQDGQDVIWIKNFEKHQLINHREAESELPAYQEGVSQVRTGVPGCAQEYTGAPMGKGREGKGREGNGREGNTDHHLAVMESVSKAFDRFWSVYPRKVGKGDARRAWQKLSPGEALVVRIVAAVERQKRSKAWLRDAGRYIPHPTTWLNQERWDDEPDPDVPSLSDTNVRNLSAGEAFLRGDYDRKR